jgi:hypothetical protein
VNTRVGRNISPRAANYTALHPKMFIHFAQWNFLGNFSLLKLEAGTSAGVENENGAQQSQTLGVYILSTLLPVIRKVNFDMCTSIHKL